MLKKQLTLLCIPNQNNGLFLSLSPGKDLLYSTESSSLVQSSWHAPHGGGVRSQPPWPLEGDVSLREETFHVKLVL